jgi:hypothetical protein
VSDGWINPGIQRAVLMFQSYGFKTVDSGDGETHDYDCDRPYPYVVIESEPGKLVSQAHNVWALLNNRGIQAVPVGTRGEDAGEYSAVEIQATYDPADGSAYIEVMYLHDRMLERRMGT